MLTLKIGDLYELSKWTDVLRSDISVMTPIGLKKVYDVDVTAFNSDVISIKTNKHELSCSPDHLIKSNNEWKKSKDFKLGDFIDTKYGIDKIVEISLKNEKRDLLDLHVETNEYYTNDILSHNSSLLESFEYVLYGKVKSGKSKKWHKLSTLPNRINGELLNTIKFESLGTEVEVKRGISPNLLELWENGVLNERAGKGNIDEKIEKYIGIDIETFKSFISMSINDFKNFISLTNEEKQLLLDKLFNLEVINILNDILKELNKSNKTRLSSLTSEISALDESVESIKRSIARAIEKEKENIQSEIDDILAKMNSKKEDYKLLKEKVDKIKEKESQLNDELDSEKKQYINTQNDIKNVQREIDLYDSGKCPTCRTDFNSTHFISLRQTLVEKRTGFEQIKLEIEGNIKSLKEKKVKLGEISEKTTQAFNDINYLLRNYKSEVEKLQMKKKREDLSESVNISEFQTSITELEEKKNISSLNSTICKEKEMYYKELNRIFGEDGVKKSIISGIIKPINHFISENVKKMHLNFEVRLNETFTAEIKSLGNSVEHDTLSTGETKLINLCVLVAYLMLIRSRKNLNILFLDEVFSSIDIENIDKIITLLKSFSNEYNINIFVVHHAILNQEMFDRVIKIEKNVFSEIIELY